VARPTRGAPRCRCRRSDGPRGPGRLRSGNRRRLVRPTRQRRLPSRTVRITPSALSADNSNKPTSLFLAHSRDPELDTTSSSGSSERQLPTPRSNQTQPRRPGTGHESGPPPSRSTPSNAGSRSRSPHERLVPTPPYGTTAARSSFTEKAAAISTTSGSRLRPPIQHLRGPPSWRQRPLIRHTTITDIERIAGVRVAAA